MVTSVVAAIVAIAPVPLETAEASTEIETVVLA